MVSNIKTATSTKLMAVLIFDNRLYTESANRYFRERSIEFKDIIFSRIRNILEILHIGFYRVTLYLIGLTATV